MIEASVVGGEKLVARMQGLSPRIVAAVNKDFKSGAFEVQSAAVQKLSGEVLNVRTGRLRRSIHIKNIGQDSSGLQSFSVGTNVEYAKVHEFGFYGVVQVHEFVRRVTTSYRTVTRGKDKGKRKASSYSIAASGLVRAHARVMRVPETSYLRSSLKEKAPGIIESAHESVRRVLAS